MKEINAALLGFGNVGRAFARYVADASRERRVAVRIRAVADASGGLLLSSSDEFQLLLAHKESGRSVKDFSPRLAITDSQEFIGLLPKAGISLLVESLPTSLTSGQPALDLLASALNAGINVVTVDKGPLVHGLDALKDAARTANAQLLFGGATGVRPPDAIAGERVLEIRGVLNGTTNYILTSMQERALSFERALADAQAAGVAEPDPSLDVQGWDTACKILILAKKFMSADAPITDVSRIGIGPEIESLIETARLRASTVRLVGRARLWQGRVRVSVAPKIVRADSPFYAVSGLSKAAVFRTEGRGEIFCAAQSGRDAISRAIIEDIEKVIA